MSEAKEKLKKIVLEEIEKLDEYEAEMLTMSTGTLVANSILRDRDKKNSKLIAVQVDPKCHEFVEDLRQIATMQGIDQIVDNMFEAFIALVHTVSDTIDRRHVEVVVGKPDEAE